MVANDTVFGVLEIASFKLFEKYEIEFVEHLAESTATTISSARVNERTKKLLGQAQYSSEQLKLHEEEVRLQQFEMNKNQEKMQHEIEALKKRINEITYKNNHLKDENEVLQNLVLKFKKEIGS
jgi:peptidoglycan hydrolase CwlO-like protein